MNTLKRNLIYARFSIGKPLYLKQGLLQGFNMKNNKINGRQPGQQSLQIFSILLFVIRLFRNLCLDLNCIF